MKVKSTEQMKALNNPHEGLSHLVGLQCTGLDAGSGCCGLRAGEKLSSHPEEFSALGPAFPCANLSVEMMRAALGGCQERMPEPFL